MNQIQSSVISLNYRTRSGGNRRFGPLDTQIITRLHWLTTGKIRNPSQSQSSSFRFSQKHTWYDTKYGIVLTRTNKETKGWHPESARLFNQYYSPNFKSTQVVSTKPILLLFLVCTTTAGMICGFSLSRISLFPLHFNFFPFFVLCFACLSLLLLRVPFSFCLSLGSCLGDAVDMDTVIEDTAVSTRQSTRQRSLKSGKYIRKL